MPWVSNFAPFEGIREDLDELVRCGRSTEACLARGAKSFRHALMDLRILAETNQRQLSGRRYFDGVSSAVDALLREGTIHREQAIAIKDLWRAGNRAAHGETWNFNRSEVIAALGQAVVVCRYQKARILRAPIDPATALREPPEESDRGHELRAEVKRLQNTLAEKHVAHMDAERDALEAQEMARKAEALNQELESRLVRSEQELSEQRSIQAAQSLLLGELQAESEEAKQLQSEIAERDARIRELEEEQDSARTAQLEVQSEIERLTKRAALGVDAYQDDYPRDDWMRIPAFLRSLIVPDSDDYRCRGPFQSYVYEGECGRGSFSETHLIGPAGGGSTAVVKIPRQPRNQTDAEQLEQDWQRETARWRQLADMPRADRSIVTPLEISPFDFPGWVILAQAKGTTLSEWAGKQGCSDPLEGLKLNERLARGLHALGEQGFAYTDLHGDNVIVEDWGPGDPRPLLIDAGDAAPQHRPPEWRKMRHRDLVNEHGAPMSALCRGHPWLLARIACLVLFGAHGQSKYFPPTEEESLAHLLGSAGVTVAPPTQATMRLDISKRLGAGGTKAVRVDWLADLICASLSDVPERRPPNAGEFADRLRKCWK